LIGPNSATFGANVKILPERVKGFALRGSAERPLRAPELHPALAFHDAMEDWFEEKVTLHWVLSLPISIKFSPNRRRVEGPTIHPVGLCGVTREIQSRNTRWPRVLACWTDSPRDGYSHDMTGVLIIALIVFALWTGSRVVGSLNIPHE
jgi:hypothetical protein